MHEPGEKIRTLVFRPASKGLMKWPVQADAQSSTYLFGENKLGTETPPGRAKWDGRRTNLTFRRKFQSRNRLFRYFLAALISSSTSSSLVQLLPVKICSTRPDAPMTIVRRLWFRLPCSRQKIWNKSLPGTTGPA